MIDRQRVRTIRERLNEVLVELGEELNLEISTTGSASFTDYNVVFKVQAAEIGVEGEAKTREADDFKFNAIRWGLSPDDLGRKFRHNGMVYEIIGAKPRSHKYPILGRRHDGKTFKFHPETVKRGIANLV